MAVSEITTNLSRRKLVVTSAGIAGAIAVHGAVAAPMGDEKLLNLLIAHAKEHGSSLNVTIPACYGRTETEVRAYLASC